MTMRDDTERPLDNVFKEKYTGRLLYVSYIFMLSISVTIFIIGIILGNYTDVIIAVPVILILTDALFFERRVVHIPPMMIFMAVGLMILILLGRSVGEYGLLSLIADLLLGIVMGLSGLILTYSLMRTMPGVRDDNPTLTSFISFSLAISFFSMILMVQYVICIITGTLPPSVEDMMEQLIVVTTGGALISISFYLNRHTRLFRRTLNRYLESRAGTIDAEEYETMEIDKAINGGESEKIEYKSTLRTNLATGEKDPRMEKAVLKTIVAFLNSRGGTLLIGINDEGEAIGIDEGSFDSRDKLNLHLTNLIASQIGNEFLPFISFKLSDYKGKGVVRVVCKKSDSPVFLKEGKQETFYVRSGPSSVELNGMDILGYVDKRFGKKSVRKRFEEE